MLGAALLAFPLGFAAYRLLLGLSHIGALHVLCLFLATALAADDTCVVASHYARLGEAGSGLGLALTLTLTLTPTLTLTLTLTLTRRPRELRQGARARGAESRQ